MFNIRLVKCTCSVCINCMYSVSPVNVELYSANVT